MARSTSIIKKALACIWNVCHEQGIHLCQERRKWVKRVVWLKLAVFGRARHALWGCAVHCLTLHHILITSTLALTFLTQHGLQAAVAYDFPPPNHCERRTPDYELVISQSPFQSWIHISIDLVHRLWICRHECWIQRIHHHTKAVNERKCVTALHNKWYPTFNETYGQFTLFYKPNFIMNAYLWRVMD